MRLVNIGSMPYLWRLDLDRKVRQQMPVHWFRAILHLGMFDRRIQVGEEG